MTTPFDAVGAHGSVAGAARSARTSAPGSGAFMQEFERALLSSRPPAPAGASVPAHTNASPRSAAHDAGGQADQARLPSEQPHEKSESSGREHREQPGPATPQARALPPEQSDTPAPADSGAGQALPHAAALPDAMLPRFASAAATPAQAALAALPLQGALPAAAMALAVTGAAANPASVAGVAPLTRQSAAPLSAAAAALAPTHEEAGSAPEAPARPQVRSGAEDKPYALRQMHVFSDDEGVQAWIRDAALSQFEANALASSISHELNGAGLKLAALTLNGKKSVLPAPSALPKKK